jgi:hypothetical protein
MYPSDNFQDQKNINTLMSRVEFSNKDINKNLCLVVNNPRKDDLGVWVSVLCEESLWEIRARDLLEFSRPLKLNE